MHAKPCQSCLTICNPKDWSPPSSSVHGILKARIHAVAMPFARGSSWPRDRTAFPASPALAGGFFTTSANWEALNIILRSNKTEKAKKHYNRWRILFHDDNSFKPQENSNSYCNELNHITSKYLKEKIGKTTKLNWRFTLLILY